MQNESEQRERECLYTVKVLRRSAEMRLESLW